MTNLENLASKKKKLKMDRESEKEMTRKSKILLILFCLFFLLHKAQNVPRIRKRNMKQVPKCKKKKLKMDR